MPTVSSSIIPPPKAWDEFEEIVLDSLKIKWNNSNLTKNGRQGQTQNGVDIYGDDSLGLNSGIQCKHVRGILAKDTILDEIKKAETFEPQINTFYIATNLNHDAKLQKFIRNLSHKRKKEGKFLVGIFFWEDIVQELIKSPSDFQKHYPQFLLRESVLVKKSGNRNLCLLDIGYYGCNLNGIMFWLFGETIGIEKDAPTQFSNLIYNLDQCARIIFEPVEAEELTGLLKNLLDYVYPYVTRKERRNLDWEPVEEMVLSIEKHFNKLEYWLTQNEAVIFKIGRLLGVWHNSEPHWDNPLPKERETDLRNLFKKTRLGPDFFEEVSYHFTYYRNEDTISVIHVPHKIYNTVRKNLLLTEN